MTDRAASGPERRVGALLGIAILILPFVFAWLLLRRGYSLRARLVGFAWAAVALGVMYSGSQSPVTQGLRQEVADTSTKSRVAYVMPMEVEVRAAPDGDVVNMFYRGQKLEIYDTKDGWVRVTKPKQDPRWVRLADLSEEPPPELPQPPLAPDERLRALPKVGEFGHTEADVRALRAGALALLDSKQCTTINDANKSVQIAGVYYVNCDEPSNRFFRIENDRPLFCGRSASDC